MCFSNNDASFIKALSIKFDEINFHYRLEGEDRVCFKQSKKAEFDKTMNEVDQYYRSVATLLKGQNKIDAVINWLSESNTDYYSNTDEDGTFIVIYSLTEEMANNNAIKLNELVYGN